MTVIIKPKAVEVPPCPAPTFQHTNLWLRCYQGRHAECIPHPRDCPCKSPPPPCPCDCHKEKP